MIWMRERVMTEASIRQREGKPEEGGSSRLRVVSEIPIVLHSTGRRSFNKASEQM